MHLRMPTCADGKKRNGRKEVIPLAKKENCGCGCVPPGKKSKPNTKVEKTKAPKKQAK
jgi:hypothetical protein